MKIEKEKFDCSFELIATREDGKEVAPCIVLKLPNFNKEPIIVLFQELGARQLSEKLIKAADEYKKFLEDNKK